MIKGRLTGLSVYEAGAIDLCPTLGKEWRARYQKRLKKEFGLVVYNPMSKPKGLINEDAQRIAYLKKLKEKELYDEYAREMSLVREIDIRMVNRSDFLIFYLDLDIHTCGSYEEVKITADANKPIMVVCKQGKKNVPGWLYAELDHNTFFNNEEELFGHLKLIHEGKYHAYTKGWLFF